MTNLAKGAHKADAATLKANHDKVQAWYHCKGDACP